MEDFNSRKLLWDYKQEKKCKYLQVEEEVRGGSKKPNNLTLQLTAIHGSLLLLR